MAKKLPGALQQRTRIARLEKLLRDAQRFVLEVSENHFTYEERYMECFWCGAGLDECGDECFAYQARVFAQKLAKVLAEREFVTQESNDGE